MGAARIGLHCRLSSPSGRRRLLPDLEQQLLGCTGQRAAGPRPALAPSCPPGYATPPGRAPWPASTGPQRQGAAQHGAQGGFELARLPAWLRAAHVLVVAEHLGDIGTGSSSSSGAWTGGPDAPGRPARPGRCAGHVVLHLRGVAGEVGMRMPGAAGAVLPDHQVGGGAGLPAFALAGRIRPDAAQGLDEGGTFALSKATCSV